MTATATKKRPASKPAALDSLTLPANEFAEAWLNVSLAQSTDDGRPILRAMCVEVYDERCVRLVATDSYKLFTSVVGPGVAYDDLASTPQQTLLVGPHAALPAALKRLRRSKNQDVTLKLTPADRLGELDCGDQVLRLEVSDGSATANGFGFPPWRTFFTKSNGVSSFDGDVAFGAKVLIDLATLVRSNPQAPIRLHYTDSLKPVQVRLAAEGAVPLYGLIMPMRAS